MDRLPGLLIIDKAIGLLDNLLPVVSQSCIFVNGLAIVCIFSLSILWRNKLKKIVGIRAKPKRLEHYKDNEKGWENLL